MSKSAKGRSGSKFQKKKLPMSKTKIDNAQSQKIVYLEKKLTHLSQDTELKHRDILTSAVIADTTPDATNLILLNGVPQEAASAGNTVREGDQFRVTSLQIRGTIDLNQNTNVGTIVRMMIFWDRQPNGVIPNVDDVLDAAVITTYVFAPLEFDTRNRYKVIYDKSVSLFPQVQATQSDTNIAAGTGANTITTSLFGSQRKSFKIFKKLNRQVYAGLGTDELIASISSNSLYFLFMSTTPNASNPPTLTFGSRIFFKDS